MKIYRVKILYYSVFEGKPLEVKGWVSADSYSEAANKIEEYYEEDLIEFNIYETGFGPILHDTDILEIIEEDKGDENV